MQINEYTVYQHNLSYDLLAYDFGVKDQLDAIIRECLHNPVKQEKAKAHQTKRYIKNMAPWVRNLMMVGMSEDDILANVQNIIRVEAVAAVHRS